MDIHQSLFFRLYRSIIPPTTFGCMSWDKKATVIFKFRKFRMTLFIQVSRVRQQQMISDNQRITMREVTDNVGI